MEPFRTLFTFIFVSTLGVSAVAQSTHTAENPPPHSPPYPARWWMPAPSNGAPDWEVLPQAAAYGEVILSKRNELGILSNFAPTPFHFRGRTYASVEGFWQATKFPENEHDPRMSDPLVQWPFSRSEVEGMTAFEAKGAGDVGSANMKKLAINWVSFEGRHMVYHEKGDSMFYMLIKDAMHAKLCQNPEVKKILLQTDRLVLRPDHHQGADDPKAWHYYDIWMEFRSQIQKSNQFCDSYL